MDELSRRREADASDIIERIMREMEEVVGLIQKPTERRKLAPMPPATPLPSMPQAQPHPSPPEAA